MKSGAEKKAETEDANACRAARRKLMIAFVKEHPGCTVSMVTQGMKKHHAKGKWPAAPWNGARQEPYDTGTRQNLDNLSVRGYKRGSRERYPLVCIEGPHPDHGWRTSLYYDRETVAALAKGLLPTGRLADQLAEICRRYRRDCGRRILVGVTDFLQPVVRVDTGRGILEEEVDQGGWAEALLRAGAIDGDHPVFDLELELR